MRASTSLLYILSTIYVLVLRLSFSPPAVAQLTDAICTNSTYAWTFNSRNQSSCVVASYLLGGCSSTPFTLIGGGPGEYYIGPTLDQANLCYCSTVVYDLVMACGVCQGGTVITWANWETNCATQYQRAEGTLPIPIPSGTSVPAWAYVTPDKMGGYFNPPVAKQFANATESTATPAPTAQPTGAPASAPPANKNNHVGAIVGGVIGGLALIILVILWFICFPKWKRRREERKNLEKLPQTPMGAPHGGQGDPLADLALVGDDYQPEHTEGVYHPTSHGSPRS